MSNCLNGEYGHPCGGTAGFGDCFGDCFADSACDYGENHHSLRLLAVEEGLRDISEGIDENCSGLYDITHCKPREGVCQCIHGAGHSAHGVCEVLESLRDVCFGELASTAKVEKGLREVRCGNKLVLEGAEHVRCGHAYKGIAEINKGILLEKIGLQDIRLGLRSPCGGFCGGFFQPFHSCGCADIPYGL